MPMHDWTKVDSGTYHYFHMRRIESIGDALNERLPKAYYAMAEQRIDGGHIPDVLALTRHEAEDDALGLGASE